MKKPAKKSRAELLSAAVMGRREMEAEAAPPPIRPHEPEPAPEPAPARKPTRSGGKRRRGHVQLCVLVPPHTRDDVSAALPLDPGRRDLSQLVGDLLAEWLESQPAHVQAVLTAMRTARLTTENPSE